MGIVYNFINNFENPENKVIFAGLLKLPTGRIVVCNPLSSSVLLNPFNERTTPGEYPVFICYSKKSIYPALAYLKFNSNQIIGYKNALQTNEKQDFVRLMLSNPGQKGISAFMDEETAKIYQDIRFEIEILRNPEFQNYDQKILERLQKNQYWLNYQPEYHLLNSILFQSGWGEGKDESYWAIDEYNNITGLFIDFIIFDSEQ